MAGNDRLIKLYFISYAMQRAFADQNHQLLSHHSKKKKKKKSFYFVLLSLADCDGRKIDLVIQRTNLPCLMPIIFGGSALLYVTNFAVRAANTRQSAQSGFYLAHKPLIVGTQAAKIKSADASYMLRVYIKNSVQVGRYTQKKKVNQRALREELVSRLPATRQRRPPSPKISKFTISNSICIGQTFRLS